MVSARVDGIEGEVWIDAAQAKAKTPFRHPPFPEETRTVLRYIQETFQTVRPLTLAEWEDGFRRDTHPQKEIDLWMVMAKGFRHFTDGRDLDVDQQQDIFQVVLASVNNGGNLEQILATTRRRTLSKNRVKEIVAYMVSLATPSGKAAPYTGAAVVPIDSLFDSTGAGPHPEANPRQVLNEVDVIFGVDVASGRQFLVYGRDVLKEVGETGKERPLRVLRIGLGPGPDELERLIALVRIIKGRDDYQDG